MKNERTVKQVWKTKIPKTEEDLKIQEYKLGERHAIKKNKLNLCQY